MEKKTIGSFIATMRKANGLTQQDVADKLNVSNKTVSKWECDESYPDIALIPVIAEMFGVSCDEILTGTRFAGENNGQYEQKAEKQIKRIVKSAVIKFKNMSLVAALLTVIGLIALFAISYGFFKPVIGFSINAIFVAISLIFVFVQYNSATDLLKDDDYPKGNEHAIHAGIRMNLYLFMVVCFNIFALIFSMPFIIVKSNQYVDSVITIGKYISFLPLIVLFCVPMGLAMLLVFRAKLGLSEKVNIVLVPVKNCVNMDVIHIALSATASLIAACYMLWWSRLGAHTINSIYTCVNLVLAAFALLTPIVFVLKENDSMLKKF